MGLDLDKYSGLRGWGGSCDIYFRLLGRGPFHPGKLTWV
jgi:hypothetical protein